MLLGVGLAPVPSSSIYCLVANESSSGMRFHVRASEREVKRSEGRARVRTQEIDNFDEELKSFVSA